MTPREQDASPGNDDSTWLAEALARMARDDPASLSGLLVSVGAPVTLGDTRATCRCSFVARDGNGRPRIHDLTKYLADRVIDYCIPRDRIFDAFEEMRRTGSSRKVAALNAEARALFSKQSKSGEGGELLLYTLLETVLRIPQILCKMPLKSNSNQHVNGTDGMHAKLLPGGNLALYWGESKMYADVNSAIDECFKSVAPFLVDAEGDVISRDLLLARDQLDAGSAEVTAALVRFFSRDSPESGKIEMRAACLAGFSLSDYPDPFDATGDEVRDEVRTAIAGWNRRVGIRIDHHKLTSFELEIFCIPVPSVDELRAAMQTALGIRA